MHHWKHGRKGSGIFWLQQARDEHCLKVISQQLFDSVGKSLSDESLKVYIFSTPYSKHISLFICPVLNSITLTCSNGKAWSNCWVPTRRSLVVLIFCTSNNHLSSAFLAHGFGSVIICPNSEITCHIFKV